MRNPPTAPDTPAIADDLIAASRAFFPDFTSIDAVEGVPSLVRVATPSGQWRVRRWPETASPGEVAFSHDVMQMARDAGLDLVPETSLLPSDPPAPVYRHAGRLYDARRWLLGVSPAKSAVSWPDETDRIELPLAMPAGVFGEIVTTLARFHDATTPLAKARGAPSAPLDLLPGAVRQAHSRHFHALRGSARREPAIQRWLASGERLLAAAEPVVLAAASETQLPVSVLHLGLWPAHMLLENEHVSGLLGWERLAVGSSLLDLAQATLRLQGWSDEAVEHALGTYGDALPLSPEERRLLPSVAALDAVASTGRLLEQTYGRRMSARPPTALRAGIDHMLRSMTSLERSLQAQESVGKPRGRVWQRGDRPAPRRPGGKPYGRRR